MQDDPHGIDLHAHTSASDGSLAPAALVQQAHALGLAALAVTDHDTIGGLAEAIAEAKTVGLTLVPGVELSVEDSGGRFHLLGYNFRPDDPALASALHTIRQSRAARNAQMADKMAALGLPVTMQDVLAEAGPDALVARPHFAQALLKKGIVSSVQDAFDRYLATGKPLYLPKEVLTPHDAIALIHNAGGVAVMAHPGLIALDNDTLKQRITSLAADDHLDGLEAYYSQHDEAQTQMFLGIARDNNLFVTGGSDFHGTPKPHVPLGIVYNGRPAPLALLDGMKRKEPPPQPSPSERGREQD